MRNSVLLTLSVFLLSSSLFSHQRSESYSKIKIEDIEDGKKIEVEYSIQTSVLQRLELNLSENWAQEFKDSVLDGFHFGEECKLLEEPFLKKSFSTGYISLFWPIQCISNNLEISFQTFFEQDPTHTHIATFTINSIRVPEKIFTNSDRIWTEANKDSASSSSIQSFYDYVNLGFNHILTGYDHLAFLLALLLLNLNFRRLILIITGFTLGHSLTLALGALDLIKPASQLVEALIGYSIIIISLEVVASLTSTHRLYSNALALFSMFLILIFGFFGTDKFLIGIIGISLFSYCYLMLSSVHKGFSLTLVVTCMFGLIHGFGFAGNLSSIGLMQDRLLPAIFGFNIGVELGQLLIIFAMYVVYSLISKIIKEKFDFVRVATASALSSIGMFWFLERMV